jgi:Sulfotransferase domain
MSPFRAKRRKIDKLDFVIAGAQKSGTTALHYYLQKHPQITLGDQQEIHFFDNDELFARPVDYELLHRHFPPVTRSTRLRDATARQAIAGDCTPSYLYHRPAMERIWNYNPAIKLIVLLRNPVERAFAHWNMQRFKNREPLDFLQAVKEEASRMQGATAVEARRIAYVDRGRYSEQLERVFKFFPREQVKLVKFEHFRGDNRDTLKSIFSFLGVRPLRVGRSKDRNVVPYEREMSAQERKYLYDIFADEIASVEQMLGWDCSDWKTV